MASKPPVASEPVGPVARPSAAKSGAGTEYKLSDAEALQLVVGARARLSRKELARLIGSTPRITKILAPHGLTGCFVDDEKTLAVFDAALARWAKANGRSDIGMLGIGPGAPLERQTTIGPADPAMLRRCREDPESCMSPQERYQLFNRRMNRMRSDGIGATLAGVGELTAAGLTAVGVPMEFDSDKFMENVAPATGALGAIGGARLQQQNMNATVSAAQPPQKTPPAIIRPANPAAPAAQSAAPAAPVGASPATKPPPPVAQPAAPAPRAPQVAPAGPPQTAKPPQPQVARPAAPAAPANQPATPAASVADPQAAKPPPARPQPVSSPTDNPDFSSVGKSVGTEAPGTVNVTPRRNTYPDFSPVSPTNQPTATAQTARLSRQLREPIPANRVLVAPWVGRVRNAQGEMMSSGTSEGWLRNESRFWSEFRRQFPSDYALIGPGRTVTPQLAQRWGWSNRTIGQKLVHHHIDNGNLVVAVPEGLHQGVSGSIHATVRVEGRP